MRRADILCYNIKNSEANMKENFEKNPKFPFLSIISILPSMRLKKKSLN